ncbi:WXG100 family type VII secretion target [Phytomonospora sp. NPDC050363]|uniref:WXG100 family type VII secretion target n=1 Tax=Phytomonospora sp. NPDC050363 TaxID=3155642 RepID=UPI0033C56A67
MTPKLAQLQAVTDDLRIAASKADSVAVEITGNLNTLLQGLAPLESGFQGGAGTSFQQVQQSIRLNLIKITDALKEVAEGVRTAGGDFDVQDSEATSLVNKTMENTDVIDRL